jgi:hypothetical protein
MNMPTSDEASETVQGSQLSSPLPIVPRASGTVKWQLLTIAAGCALTAMFFLPLDNLSNWSSSSEVPAKVVVEMLGRASIQSLSFHAELLVLVAYVFSLTVLPHVWGLLMVLYSLGSLLKLRWLRALPHALGVFIGVALGATSIVGMTFYLPRFLSQLGGAVRIIMWPLLSAVSPCSSPSSESCTRCWLFAEAVGRISTMVLPGQACSFLYSPL